MKKECTCSVRPASPIPQDSACRIECEGIGFTPADNHCRVDIFIPIFHFSFNIFLTRSEAFLIFSLFGKCLFIFLFSSVFKAKKKNIKQLPASVYSRVRRESNVRSPAAVRNTHIYSVADTHTHTRNSRFIPLLLFCRSTS